MRFGTWFLAGLALLLLAIFGGRTALLFLLFLVVLAFLGFFLSRGNPSSLRITRRIYPTRLSIGETATVELSLENHGSLPLPWLEIWDTPLPYMLSKGELTRFALSLKPGENRVLSYKVMLNKRGFYDLPPLLVRTGDPWGLWRQERRESAPASLLVFPRILSLERMHLPLRKPFEGQKSGIRAYEDITALAGVRDYIDGDPMKRIHWKLSAHLGHLLVKEFDYSTNTVLSIWLDLASDGRKEGFMAVYEDFAVMAAAALLHLAQEQHAPSNLCILPELGPTDDLGSGKDHFLRQMEQLARSAPKGGNLWEAMRLVGRHLPWQSNLVLISPILDPAFVMRLVELRQRTRHLTLFLLYEGSFLLPWEKPRQSYLMDPQEVAELRRCSALLEKQGVHVRLVGGNDLLMKVI